jgi:cytochrome c oxidase subunit 2
MRKLAGGWKWGAVPALASGSASAEMAWNFQEGATRAAQQVNDLHWLMMIIILIIFVGVFGVMFYSIFAHRKSVGHKAAQFHENTTVELIWTVVPFLILILMAWPATKALLNLRDTSAADITIKTTGYQWKWGYDYLKGQGEGISFLSQLATPYDQIYGNAPKSDNYLLEVDNELVVPVGKKVRILTTASDVIHSWFVPALSVKQDAIPGFVRETAFRADREGVFRGQCAELCGKEHGFMPIVVKVVSQEQYTAWVGEQRKKMAAAADDVNKEWMLDELNTRGEKVYAANCAACHQANGQGVPNAFPSLVGSKVVLGPADDQIALLLHGRKGVFMPGSAMPAQENLSDVDLAAVATYTRNAWGNAAEDKVVQPAEVKADRGKK